MNSGWEEWFQSINPTFTAILFLALSVIVLQLAFFLKVWHALDDISEIKKLLEDKLNNNQNQK